MEIFVDLFQDMGATYTIALPGETQQDVGNLCPKINKAFLNQKIIFLNNDMSLISLLIIL